MARFQAKEADFKLANEAYNVLVNESKRKKYDISQGYQAHGVNGGTSNRPHKPRQTRPRRPFADGHGHGDGTYFDGHVPPVYGAPPPGFTNDDSTWRAWHYGDDAVWMDPIRQRNAQDPSADGSSARSSYFTRQAARRNERRQAEAASQFHSFAEKEKIISRMHERREKRQAEAERPRRVSVLKRAPNGAGGAADSGTRESGGCSIS